MKILDDLISTINKSPAVTDIRQGLFHTAVVTDKCGLAATLPRDVLQQEQPHVKEPGLLLEKGISELLALTNSKSIPEAAIGMATLNSLIEVDEDNCFDLNARELISEKGEAKRVTIIGHFPFIPRLRDITKELWVIEKNPKEGDYSESTAEYYVPQSDVVAITGTAFTNHTIEHLLSLCRPGAYVVMLGDTTPLSPVLFDYGIDAICGTMVINTAEVLLYVSQGATYRQIKGTRQLTMLKNKTKEFK